MAEQTPVAQPVLNPQSGTEHIELPEVVVRPNEDGSHFMTKGVGAQGQPGLTYTVQENQLAARAVGHSWEDIGQHVDTGRAGAKAAGYSDAEIDAYLGYTDPTAARDQMRARAQETQAETPSWAGDMSAIPVKPEEPVDEKAKELLLNPKSRFDYADALAAGQVQGAQDWALQQAKHFIDGSEGSAERAERLATEVSKEMPTQADVLDAAAALTHEAGKPVNPQTVAVTKARLLHEWARTNKPIGELFATFRQSPEQLDWITQAEKGKPEPTSHETRAVNTDNMLGEMKKAHPEWFDPKLAQQGDRVTHWAVGPGGTIVAEMFGSGDWKKTLEAAGIEVASWYVGGKVAGWALKAAGKIVSHIWTKTPTFDPLASPGMTEKLEEPLETAVAHWGKKSKSLGEAKTLVEADTGNVYEHEILDEGGNKIGQVTISTIPGHPEKVHINSMELGETMFKRDEAGRELGANKLGLSAMRSLAREFFAKHPEVEEMSGFRIGGAKVANGKYETATVTREKVMPHIDRKTGELVGAEPAEADAGAIHMEMSRAMYGGFWPKDVARGLGRLFFGPQWEVDKAYETATTSEMKRIARFYMSDHERVKNAFALRLEPMRKAINQHMDDYTAWLQGGRAMGPGMPAIGKLLEFLDGRKTINILNSASELKPVAQAMQGVIADLKNQVTAISNKDFERFFRGYFAQLWTEPRHVVEQAFGGIPKGINTIPSPLDGIARGLTPKFVDPIDFALQYSATLSKFVNDSRWIEEMVRKGLGKWGMVAPVDGWKPLSHSVVARRISSLKVEQVFAPPGAARIWNVYAGEGIHSNPTAGMIYDKLNRFANIALASRLAWVGFHVADIAAETQVAKLSTAIGEIPRADVARGLKEMGLSASLIPGGVDLYRKGAALQADWRDLANHNPLAELLFHAGLRAEGRSTRYQGGAAFDIQRLAEGASFRQMIGRGNFWQTMRREFTSHPMKALVDNYFRILDTFNAPLFDDVIPKLKIGAASDEMESWLRRNPAAAYRDAQEQAMRIVDRIDDTFGELNQDNLFWNRTFKQVLNSITVSVGWEYGSIRAYSRGLKELFWDGDLSGPYARWMSAFVAQTAMKNSVYQALHTGQFPWQTDTPAQDFMNPRTGGTFTYKGTTTPERARLPGYEKEINTAYRDMVAWTNVGTLAQNVMSYPLNKLRFPYNLPFQIYKGTDEAGNRLFNQVDEKGQPITSIVGIELPNGLASFTRHVAEQFEPITVQQLMQRYKGTHVWWYERLMGVSPSGTYFQQPEETMKRMEKKDRLDTKLQRNRQRSETERLEE